MENQDKFSTFDRAILAVCLIVVLLCAFLMTQGRFSSDDTSKLSAVGRIERSENDVRQKHQTGFNWRGADNADAVFEGDSIFTGESSKVKVIFNGGGELEIDPKSLVVINTRNGELELDLRYGAFSGNLSEGQKITVIKDGERTVVTGKGKRLTISDADFKKPSPQKLVKGINLNSPNSNSVYWNGEINYSWTDVEEKAPYMLEFSAGATFKKKIAEFELADLQMSAKPDFQLYHKANKREFFWRVRSKAKPTLVSEVRKVTIYKDVPPALTTPAHNFIQYVTPEVIDGSVVQLTWTEPGLSQEYNVQISKDEGFNELVTAQATVNLKFDTSPLEQGEYFWRVQGTHPLRSNAPWSEIRKFTVIEKAKVLAPKLAASEKVYVLPLNKVLKQASNKKYEKLGVPVSDYPTFKWNQVTGASAYDLEVSTDKSFNTFASHKVEPTSPEFKFAVMKPGTMVWRVRTVLANGESTEPSAASQVKTELPPPPTKNVETQTDALKVSWSPLIFARHYEVQWSTDDQFNAPSSATTSADSYLIKPTVSPQYSLFWRIRALDQQKRPLSAFSESQVLRAVRKLASNEGADESITRPIPREPRAQTSVVSFDEAPVFLNFKWSKVPQVENYRFELARTPEFTDEPVFSTVVNSDQLLINQRLPAGEYYWRIRGENEEGGWTVWSDPALFVVQFK